jgi:phosphonate transport system substrate-binding protein
MKFCALMMSLMTFTLLSACEKSPDDSPLNYSVAPANTSQAIYRLVPHPLYNPQKLSETFQPLVNYLNQKLPEIRIELEASRNYQAFEQKFRAREAEFLMPNPWQTLEAIKVGYEVIAMWGDAADFKGIFIVRKDSGIKNVQDLKGKIVSYPSPTALAAAIMPQYFLHSQGLNVNQDIQNSYVGSQESSIMNVFLGQSVAGATWPPPWRIFQKQHPTEAAQLKVMWETPSLINNSVMVRNDVPAAIRQKVQTALLDLPNSAEGKKILATMETARFHAANNQSYDVVREYITRFENEVRPVESK